MEITIVFFSWGYWDVSLPLVIPFQSIYSIGGTWTLLQAGCPIRKSTDQRLIASPRGLSQLTTSFIVFTYQGIHHMPLITWLTPYEPYLFSQIDNIFTFINIFNNFKKQKKIFCGADRDWTCDPLRAREVLSQLSYSPKNIIVVGLGRLELPTPALSERCSNQLSYKPRVILYCRNE